MVLNGFRKSSIVIVGLGTIDRCSHANCSRTWSSVGIRPEESPNVKICFNLDLDVVKTKVELGCPKLIGDGVAGAERGERIFDRIGSDVAASECCRFVDCDPVSRAELHGDFRSAYQVMVGTEDDLRRLGVGSYSVDGGVNERTEG